MFAAGRRGQGGLSVLNTDIFFIFLHGRRLGTSRGWAVRPLELKDLNGAQAVVPQQLLQGGPKPDVGRHGRAGYRGEDEGEGFHCRSSIDCSPRPR